MRRNMRYSRQQPVQQKQQKNNQPTNQAANQKKQSQNQANNQKKQCKNTSCRQSCSAGFAYVGNIFLLGLATLLTELINLQAATALETLLDPFVGDSGTELEQEILAAGLDSSLTDIDLLDVAEEQNV